MRKKITILGSGYVGAITGIGLANLGHLVRVVDTDSQKVKNWTDQNYPIFENDLDQYYQRGVKNGLTFSSEIDDTSDFYFIAVGTPKDVNSGNADLTYVTSAIETISSIAKSKAVVVMKSTVPVGTNTSLLPVLTQNNSELSLVSNPEFLREGSAFSDFFEPDRIVLGGNEPEAVESVSSLYQGLVNIGQLSASPLVLKTTFESAELIKHASNGFLAIKLSYINEIAQLSTVSGADYLDVISGMGADTRIGTNFLRPGPGWGGSCFPKDSIELCATSSQLGVEQSVLNAAIQSNKTRQDWCADQAIRILRAHDAKRVGIFGLAFKANTDDVRETPALQIVKRLRASTLDLVLTDEQAVDNFKVEFAEDVVVSNLSNIFTKIDSAVILTEWASYSAVNWTQLLKDQSIKCVVDFRNVTHSHNCTNIYRY